jgi:hypothetical protein
METLPLGNPVFTEMVNPQREFLASSTTSIIPDFYYSCLQSYEKARLSSGALAAAAFIERRV